ncbi:hypothetical protein [Streptomyces niveus]|uniref:hypothetical protein n=1 Tax=Streptomyces niveus TaxID=193462 RepID=UPI00341F8A76
MTTREAENASPQDRMQQSLDRARITARVDVADDQSTLLVVLLGGSRLPFLHFSSADEATTWLENAGIRASADTDEDDNVVLHLPRDTVDTVRELLTADYLRAEDAAHALQHALHQAGITLATVTVETPDALVIEIADSDNLATGVNLGVLLGADSIAQGLALHRPKGMRKLARRLCLVLTGAVGSAVDVHAESGCAHRDDRLAAGLRVDQALALADRISDALPSPRRTPAHA